MNLLGTVSASNLKEVLEATKQLELYSIYFIVEKSPTNGELGKDDLKQLQGIIEKCEELGEISIFNSSSNKTYNFRGNSKKIAGEFGEWLLDKRKSDIQDDIKIYLPELSNQL